jgi:hypothetical protein
LTHWLPCRPGGTQSELSLAKRIMRLMIYVTHAADCERAFLLNELAACRGMPATGLADALFCPIVRRTCPSDAESTLPQYMTLDEISAQLLATEKHPVAPLPAVLPHTILSTTINVAPRPPFLVDAKVLPLLNVFGSVFFIYL